MTIQMNGKLLGTLCFAMLLGGCASGPKLDQVQTALPPLDPEYGRLFVYRTALHGAAILPEVELNGQKLGKVKPWGFFYVDRPAGEYEISTSIDADRPAGPTGDAALADKAYTPASGKPEPALLLSLAKGQIRYVRLNISVGLFAGHVHPVLVDSARGETEIRSCKFFPSTFQSP
jgi:hypothetical protein